ncbi:MAG: MerR family transcriptional regulator [Planctomycetes bacterium]|nr:MerR family transcriptional regulator [Planctomycetota bacterium]
MATISQVAKLFDVDCDTVKFWVTEFAEHVTLAANPAKGQTRQFNEADLRALALVAELWEDEPDYENIHAMLNCGEHNGERFTELARLHTPIFQDVPDDIDETWQGALIGGMAMRDWVQVARSYKTAADELVRQALSQFEPHEIDYPIIFLYRHSIELYLKTMLKAKPETHVIAELIGLLEQQVGSKLAGWVKDRLWDFHRIDEQSDMFRYAGAPSATELWVNLHQLKGVMDRLAAAFEDHIASETAARTGR